MENLKIESLLNHSSILLIQTQMSNVMHQDLLGFLNSEDGNAKHSKDFILYPKVNDWKGAMIDEVTQRLFVTYKNLARNGFYYISGSFAFSIPAAVHRQTSFTDKMYEYGWLHAPFTDSTMNRARVRYLKFFELMSDFEMLEPKLDVDLVWHTHMLSPSKYRDFCLFQIGKMVYHDDKSGEYQINRGFKSSEAAWEERFCSPFTVCLCWFCEATRDGGVPENRNNLIKAITKERAHRYQAGMPIETKFKVTGCKDCGLHPRTDCLSFSVDKACPDSEKRGPQRQEKECCDENEQGCECEEYCSSCECEAPCENPNCHCEQAVPKSCRGRV
jgi:hypothetical protein